MCSRTFYKNFFKKLPDSAIFDQKLKMRVIWLVFLGVNCSENNSSNKTEDELDQGYKGCGQSALRSGLQILTELQTPEFREYEPIQMVSGSLVQKAKDCSEPLQMISQQR